MKRVHILQMGVLSLFGMGVLLSMAAFDPSQLRREQGLLELSVIIREAESSGWTAARQGMEQAAFDLGAELRFLTLDEKGNINEQRSLLARETGGGADAVILVPADTAALAPDVRQASEQIPIVTIESDMSESGAAACVSTDNAALGRALGRAAINGVPAGGRVLLLDSAPGSSGIAQRLSQAAQVLQEGGRRIELLRSSDPRELEQLLEERCRTGPPDAVLAFEPSVLEMAAQLSRALEKPPLLYGMGGNNIVVSALERGEVRALAAQNEFAVGYLAVQAAVNAAESNPQTAAEPLPFSIIRQEDMYDSDNQKLLFPVTR